MGSLEKDPVSILIRFIYLWFKTKSNAARPPKGARSSTRRILEAAGQIHRVVSGEILPKHQKTYEKTRPGDFQ